MEPVAQRAKPVRITVAMLKEKQVCSASLRTFRRLFGRSASATPRNAIRLAKTGMCACTIVDSGVLPAKVAARYRRARDSKTAMSAMDVSAAHLYALLRALGHKTSIPKATRLLSRSPTPS